MLFRASFVWGLNNESTSSPFGLIKKVAGTAGGVWMPQISLGWVISEGTWILNFFAIGSKSSWSSWSKLKVNTNISLLSSANSFSSGISFIQGAHQSAQ